MSDAVRELVAVIDFDYDLGGLKKFGKEFDNLEDSVQDLGGGLDDAAKDFDAFGKKGKKSTEGIGEGSKKSKKEIGGLGDKGKSALGGIMGAGNKAAESLLDFIPNAGIAGRAMAGLSTAGVAAGAAIVAAFVGVSAAILDVANDIDVTSDKIAAKMGASAEETADMLGASLEVYKEGYGENLKDVQESVGLVKQDFRDLSDSDLASATKDIITMRDVFDQETKEINAAVKNMTSNFDGLQIGGALDLITVGFQKGGSSADDLLDVVKEYSVYFSKLGASPEQFIGTLIRGAEEGVYTMDFMADAVKELGIRSIDGSKDTTDAFTKLGFKADDMQKKFAAGGDTANQAMMATVAALSFVGDAAEQNAIGVQLFGTKWEDVREDAIFAMDGAEEAVKGFEGATEAAAEQVRDNFSGKMKQAGREISGTFMELVANSGASDWLTDIGDDILTNFAPAVSEGLLNTVDAIKSFISENKEEIDTIINGITNTFQGAFDIISGLWFLLGPLITGVFGDAFDLVMDILATVVGYIGDTFAFISALISGDWAGAWDLFQSIFENALNGLINIGEGLLNLLFNAFDNTIGRIIEAIWGVDLTEAGHNIIDGLINGVKAKAQAAIDTVKGIASSIYESVTGFFNIHSPSRLMKEVGGFVVDGMNIGMSDMSDDAVKTAIGVGEDVFTGFDKAFAKGVNPMVNTPRTVSDGLQAPVNDFNDVPNTNAPGDENGGKVVNVGGIKIEIKVDGDDSGGSKGKEVADEVTQAIENYFKKLNIIAS